MNQLGMFAKYWEPGRVKTRLARSIGPQQAASLYRSFLVTLVDRLADVGDTRELCFTPPDYQREFSQLAGTRWNVHAQADGDLGRRMDQFFRRRRSPAPGPIVLIGSDAPTLPIAFIHQAFRQLEQHYQVVLGPSEDGGYYLVGIAGDPPPIFDEIEWGSAAVWEQTIGRLESHGINWSQLPTWYDIDTVGDLFRLRVELSEPTQASDHRLRTLREAVERALERHP